MPKLILTQIVKNEAHVITRMLDSIKSITDAISIVDTGSTDDTIAVIKKWGEDNGIETHVFERPFDNFEASRNYSIECSKNVTSGRGDDWWGFWLDADEVIEIGPRFRKENISKDLYMFETYIGQMKYTRNEMFRLNRPFRFYGPIHEFIVCDEKNITSDVMEGITVRVRMDGGSWKENIGNKYKNHATVLEKYLDENRSDARWIFYTAQSWHDSACVKDDREENEERLRRSLKYYKERVSRPDGYHEEIYYAQYRIGTILRAMESPWNITLNELLKAYSFDPLRGESIKAIIDYYIAVGENHNAYLFSSFAMKNFHNRSPYPKRLLFVEESLYAWKFLETHAAACYFTGRMDEAKQTYADMTKIYGERPELFSPEDVQKLQVNAQFFK